MDVFNMHVSHFFKNSFFIFDSQPHFKVSSFPFESPQSSWRNRGLFQLHVTTTRGGSHETGCREQDRKCHQGLVAHSTGECQYGTRASPEDDLRSFSSCESCLWEKYSALACTVCKMYLTLYTVFRGFFCTILLLEVMTTMLISGAMLFLPVCY